MADESGATAIEFSLLASIFFIFVFGIFQLGYALHCGASVRWALETSARTLLLTPSTTQAELKTAMLTHLTDVPNSNSVTVTLVTDNSNPAAKVLTATSAYAYPLSIPLLPTYNLQFNARVAVPTP
jgi:Flp pilus assembly protein TadG